MPPPMQDKKITLNLKQVATPPPAPKPQPQPQPQRTPSIPKPIVPPVQPQPIVEKKPEPTPEPEPLKEKILDLSTKRFAQKSTKENNVTKRKKKKIKKKIVKKKVTKKKKTIKKKKRAKRTQRSQDPLANFLRGSTKSFKYTKSPKRRSRTSSHVRSYGEQMIQNLYGPEFNSFTPTQKKFIRNNLSTIHRITQNTLTRNGYPSVAVRTQQQGTNIVSFYLHPNGDISRLKLKTPIGYASLDQNTLDVIRIAYKDYPLPNKTTKIVFYVRYSLY